MQLRCSFSNNEGETVCGGRVVPCTEFPLPDEQNRMSWSKLYGSINLRKAQNNMGKAICLSCSALYDLQLELPFSDPPHQHRPNPFPPNSTNQRVIGNRYEWTEVRDNSLFFVIADYDNGKWTCSEREAWEARWFPMKTPAHLL